MRTAVRAGPRSPHLHPARPSALVWSCVAALGLTPTAGCGRAASEPGGARDGAPRTAAVTAGPLEDVFLLTGEIAAVRSIEFSAPSAWGEARIQWLAEDGAQVRAGDVLIAYEGGDVLGQLEDKRLKVTQAEIDLESRLRSNAADAEDHRAAVERAEVEWRQAELRAAVPAELQPRRDWQEKQNALRRARAALEKARLEAEAAEAAAHSGIETARLALDKARRDLDATRDALAARQVRAPRDGIFIVRDHWDWSEGRKLQAGDRVFVGQTVASLPDLRRLEVRARLSAVDAGRIAAGQEARCVLDTYPERVYAGRVAEVGSVAQAGLTAGFPVRVALGESDPERMRPGMSVRVEVVRRRFERALLVPREALERREERAFVRRAGGGPREVELAACTPTLCAVRSGLREGERVALP